MEYLIIALLIINLMISLSLLFLYFNHRQKQPDIHQSLSQQRQELILSLKNFTESLENKLNRLTDMVADKLEIMRQTVDEKLQTSLERRLNESFKQVSERLAAVYQGLGEMKNLASGVGDLKKVLTNVKTRGTWGEVQLGNLLEQFLAQSDYVQNVSTKQNSKDRVEFAIKLPSKNDDHQSLLLPIDAKFPLEDYQRLQDAIEQNDLLGIEQAKKDLGLKIKKAAKDISGKYLDPPQTTDFAIMYLPLEGLYAQVTQNLSWCETLQKDYRVTVMGPNNIAAFLSSLQLGFRTLTIEKRSAEVWSLLGQIQTEFHKFGDILNKTQKKLQEASNIIGEAQSKSTTITRKLAKVEQTKLTNGEQT